MSSTAETLPESRATMLAEATLALLLAAASLVFLMRSLVFTGFDSVSADDLDGALQLALLEHWHNVLTGAGSAPWNQPNFFHPVPDTLGYNDGYLLFGLVFTALRSLGLDSLLAQELTPVFFRLAGFLGIWVLVRRFFGGSVLAAAFASMLFTIGHPVSLSLFHSQLALAGLTPWALVLAGIFLEALKEGRAGAAFAGLASLALLFGSWILSGFYTAWFTAMLMLFGGLVVLLWRRSLAVPYLTALRAPGMAAAVLVGAALSLPFLVAFFDVYASKLRETGGHPAAVVLEYLPHFPQDLLNIGADNLVWSATLEPLYRLLSGTQLSTGPISGMFPPLTSAALVIAAIRGRRWTSDCSPQMRAVLAAAIAGTFFFYLVDFQVGGWSPWLMLDEVLPGASGLRVIPRFNVVLLALAAIVLALWLQWDVARRTKLLAALVGLALLAEQTSIADLRRMQRGTVEAFLAEAGMPPASCAAFYAVNPPEISLFWPGVRHDRPVIEWMAADIPAMLVASAVHLPTVNGHASFLPEGWFLKKPSSDDYLARIQAYARERGVGSLCSLDLTARRWALDAANP